MGLLQSGSPSTGSTCQPPLDDCFQEVSASDPADPASIDVHVGD